MQFCWTWALLIEQPGKHEIFSNPDTRDLEAKQISCSAFCEVHQCFKQQLLWWCDWDRTPIYIVCHISDGQRKSSWLGDQMEQYISTCNTFPETCRVTFKLFSGFCKAAKHTSDPKYYKGLCFSSSSSTFLMRGYRNRFISLLKMETSARVFELPQHSHFLFLFIGTGCIFSFYLQLGLFSLFGHKFVHYQSPILWNRGKMR